MRVTIRGISDHSMGVGAAQDLLKLGASKLPIINKEDGQKQIQLCSILNQQTIMCLN
jgi:hypothetical protein